ncbi:single-stranded-DNA-specific exonuclease C-terminal domain-containing protein [Paenibacillus protaetiae]|uniref:single-stranded-DNA-specific exonuclease C-terminal domain-containing protein n=1 Tax=Paenibacillus protaetiae TaxID=2509456 RepID=UPI001FC9B760|nr:single-stranded-DNA-specific exonuclease C-terminal domain-containing protein [Paenibacillus protaetiae]
MGKDNKHLKLTVRSRTSTLDVIGFGYGEHAALINSQTELDLLGELSVNEWNGQRKPQLQIHDLRTSPPSPAFPEREQFGLLYKHLRQHKRFPIEGLTETLARTVRLTPEMIALMLDVFTELEFIRLDEEAQELVVADSPAKRDLSSSEAYRAAKRQTDTVYMSGVSS